MKDCCGNEFGIGKFIVLPDGLDLGFGIINQVILSDHSLRVQRVYPNGNHHELLISGMEVARCVVIDKLPTWWEKAKRPDPDKDIYVYVIHHPTRKAYALNRRYEFLATYENAEVPANRIESEDMDGWTCHAAPEWCKEFPLEEFTAYWLY